MIPFLDVFLITKVLVVWSYKLTNDIPLCSTPHNTELNRGRLSHNMTLSCRFGLKIQMLEHLKHAYSIIALFGSMFFEHKRNRVLIRKMSNFRGAYSIIWACCVNFQANNEISWKADELSKNITLAHLFIVCHPVLNYHVWVDIGVKCSLMPEKWQETRLKREKNNHLLHFYQQATAAYSWTSKLLCVTSVFQRQQLRLLP